MNGNNTFCAGCRCERRHLVHRRLGTMTSNNYNYEYTFIIRILSFLFIRYMYLNNKLSKTQSGHRGWKLLQLYSRKQGGSSDHQNVFSDFSGSNRHDCCLRNNTCWLSVTDLYSWVWRSNAKNRHNGTIIYCVCTIHVQIWTRWISFVDRGIHLWCLPWTITINLM